MAGRTRRRDYGSGSVYQDKNGYWRASIELGWEKGKRRRKTISGKTKSDVVDKLKTYSKQLDTTGTLAVNVPKVEDWLQRWVDDIASLRLKPRTLISYRSEIRKHINPWLGHYKLDKLTAAHIADWHKTLRAEPVFRPTSDKPMAESSVLKAHAVLSRALEDAVRLDVIPRNPAKNVDRPKKRARDKREPLSTDDALALLRHVRNDPKGSRWAAALMLGSRQGETLGLEWNRVDLESNLVELSWQLQRLPYTHGCHDDPCGKKFAGNCPDRRLDVAPDYEYQHVTGALALTRPKNERPRVVPMPLQLLAWLREERKQRPDDRFVWQRDDDRPLDPRADYDNAKALLAELGHDNTTLHEFRHTTNSLLLRLGVPEPIRMAIAGHSVVATQRGYAHVDVTLMREAMERLDDALQIEELEP